MGRAPWRFVLCVVQYFCCYCKPFWLTLMCSSWTLKTRKVFPVCLAQPAKTDFTASVTAIPEHQLAPHSVPLEMVPRVARMRLVKIARTAPWPHRTLITGRACVEACPAGFVPNADKDCTECGQDLFADHATKECVGTCGTGFAGNATSNDCEKCVGETPYADHTAHTCVAECPSGSVGSLTTSDDDQFGSCDACADGEFADHNQHKCVAAETDCPAGSNPRDSTHNCDHSCTAAANGNSLYWDDSDD